MDDQNDLNKILDVIKSTRQENPDDFQYQEFIISDDSDIDEDDTSNTDDFNFNETFTNDIANLYKYNPTSSYKSDEEDLINSCNDPDLKKILILNREKNKQLIQMYKKYQDLLIECKQNILEKKDIIKQYYQALAAQKKSSGAWRVCAPYFKDKGFYVCPPNSDFLIKKRNKELSYYDLMPPKKWSKYECERLIKTVKLNYNCNLSVFLKKKIKQLEMQPPTEEIYQEIKSIKTRLNKTTNAETFEVPQLGSDEHINWIRVAEVFIRDMHSDFECRAFWNIFLHPSINKTAFKEDENNRLRDLAVKYKYQNWDLIAKELETNRTCFTVAKHYFSNFHNTFKRGDFTLEEDRKLLDLVKKYRMGGHIPWVSIARNFKNRSRSQLHHRYTYYLSQCDKRRGKFCEAEDVMILIIINKYGITYQKCAEYLPDRSVSQIKARYSSNLRGLLIKGLWTVEEDERILDYVSKAEGKYNLWSGLTGELKRSRGQIRQRYNVIKDFLSRNPGSTVKDVPRRKHQHKMVETYSVVRWVADYFVEQDPEKIPTLEEIEIVLQHYHTMSESNESEKKIKPTKTINFSKDLDDLIVDFFCNSHTQPVASLTPNNLREAVDNIEVILDTLKADLDIPDDLTGLDLDYADLEIIKELKKRGKLRRNNIHIKRILPASFHTATAIRILIVNYLYYKNEMKIMKPLIPSKNERIFGDFDSYPQKTILQSLISEELSQLSDSDKNKLEADRDLFYRRFLSLFKWPAVLTLEPPSSSFMSIVESIDIEKRQPVKRTYSRKQNTEAPQPSKIRILEDNAAQNLNLTPVDNKSILVNLLNDNTRKLFFMDKVQCGKQTKTLIKEVDLDFLNRIDITNNPSTSKMKSVEDTYVDVSSSSTATAPDDDFLDLNKLTNFMKKEKGTH